MNREAKELFESKLKGKNLITPDIIDYGESGPFFYELSEGEGMRREKIYGVTILEKNGRRRNDLSQCFYSRHEADLFIERLEELKSLDVNGEDE